MNYSEFPIACLRGQRLLVEDVLEVLVDGRDGDLIKPPRLRDASAHGAAGRRTRTLVGVATTKQRPQVAASGVENQALR